jgi:uncharacterized protein
MDLRPLSLIETRVLGVLIEKQHTVPDTYPLSLNALVAGCNQKTSRDPIMEATEAEVQRTIDALKSCDLVVESSGGRVARYAQNFARVLGLPSQAVALLTVLMLRGPQTLSELRINSERMHPFADISAVDAFMRELAVKSPARVLELPKATGAREPRWVHLLSGAVDVSKFAPQVFTSSEKPVADLSLATLDALTQRIEALETSNAALKATVAQLCAELGITA